MNDKFLEKIINEREKLVQELDFISSKEEREKIKNNIKILEEEVEEIDKKLKQEDLEEEVYEIEKVTYHKQFVLLKFKGVDDMTTAELKLKNKLIKIDDSDALPLEEDEYYIRDLMGCEVVTTEGENLGKVKDILFTGANDVYIVDNGEKEVLIPATKNCVQEIDIENKMITIELLKGLI